MDGMVFAYLCLPGFVRALKIVSLVHPVGRKPCGADTSS